MEMKREAEDRRRRNYRNKGSLKKKDKKSFKILTFFLGGGGVKIIKIFSSDQELKKG